MSYTAAMATVRRLEELVQELGALYQKAERTPAESQRLTEVQDEISELGKLIGEQVHWENRRTGVPLP